MPVNSDLEIGRLQAGQQAMVTQLAELSSLVQAGQEEGREGRSRIYKELENGRESDAAIKRDLHEIKRIQATHAETIIGINRWKERFIGAWGFGAMLCAATGGAVALLWKWIAVKIGMN